MKYLHNHRPPFHFTYVIILVKQNCSCIITPCFNSLLCFFLFFFSLLMLRCCRYMLCIMHTYTASLWYFIIHDGDFQRIFDGWHFALYSERVLRPFILEVLYYKQACLFCQAEGEVFAIQIEKQFLARYSCVACRGEPKFSENIPNGICEIIRLKEKLTNWEMWTV